MHKFIQRNKKKLLAVFGVLLMIVFIIPTTAKNFSHDDVVIGKIGDEKISSQDVRRAQQDLQTLQRPLLQLMFQDRRMTGPVAMMYQIVAQCREKPSIYVVLQKEAQAAGVVVPESEVDDYMQRLGVTGQAQEDMKGALQRLLSVQLNYDRVASRVKVTLPEVMNGIAQQQRPTLNVMEFKAEDFMASAPNPPEEEIVKAWQKYGGVSPEAAGGALQVVKFGYLIPEKVKLQYIKLPLDRLQSAAFHLLSESDLVAIDRVAVLYYSKHEKDFLKAPTDSSTKPATAPAVKPFREVQDDLRRRTLLGELQPDESTPAEYKEALEAVKQHFKKSIDQLEQRYIDRLNADFQAHQKGEPILLDAVPAAPSTQPSTQPAAQPAAARQEAPPFESVAYLEAVFNNVLEIAERSQPSVSLKGKDGLPPPSEDVDPAGPQPLARRLEGHWYSKTDLNQLQGISGASAGNDRFAEIALRTVPTENSAATQPSTAPSAAAPATVPAASPATAPSATSPASEPATGPTTTAATAPTTNPTGLVAGPTGKSAWAMFQPSPLLKSGEDADAYVFRLTAYEPQRVPELKDVREQIVKDLKTMQAFKQAHDKAESIYKEVLKRKDEGKGLSYMADMMGTKVITTGPLMPGQTRILGYDDLKDPLAAQILAGSAHALLQKVTLSDMHPLQVIDLPPARRTVVAEIRDVERGWLAEQDYSQARGILQTLQSNSQMLDRQPLLDRWLNPDEVTRRTGYQATGRGG